MIPLTCLLLAAATLAPAQTPIKDVLAQVDGTTGRARDNTTEFKITGFVSARVTLPNDQVLAFVQPSGEAGLPVLTSAAEAAGLVQRNEVMLAGKFVDGPFGWSALALTGGSLVVQATNKPFGASTPLGPSAFKDASAHAGRYVQVTNVTFVAPTFDGSGVARVKGDDDGELAVLVSKSVAGLATPTEPVNAFGVPVRVAGEWRLLAARFLPVSGKATQALAGKHTCITCHNPDTKLIGPTYRDVAAKYRRDPEAEAKLIAQMETGGSGKWGQVPMIPFKGRVPPEEMKQLAAWILGYRWDALLAE